MLSADPEALADLRARALEPLDDLTPAAASKLVETLRLWLLLGGRREAVAPGLFVHPQTVRYRMGQLRELFGDDLDDPRRCSTSSSPSASARTRGGGGRRPGRQTDATGEPTVRARRSAKRPLGIGQVLPTSRARRASLGSPHGRRTEVACGS